VGHVTDTPSTARNTVTTPDLKVRPTALIGFAVAIGYPLLFTVLELLMKVPYTEIGTTTDSIVRGIVIPLAVCTVVMAVLASVLGWWRPVMREKPLGVKWMWAVPVILSVMVIAGIDYTQFGAIGLPYLGVLALGTAMVGFNEEITYRGIALVAFRGQYKEVWAWLLTSLMFGLLHGANLVLGQPIVPTIVQVVFAFVLGTTFYVARRVTGSLLFMMVIHALWDFGSFSFTGGLAATGVRALNPTALATYPLLLVMLIVSAIGWKKLFGKPAEYV
jgi:membrane protease YdiL (CAAX protease family)